MDAVFGTHRVLAVTSPDGSVPRYIGQFVIDQQTSIEPNPPKTKAPGDCYRLLPLGEVGDDPALHPRSIVRVYEPPTDTQPPAGTVITQTISKEKMEWANRTHTRLQNQLASFVEAHGLRALSPAPTAPSSTSRSGWATRSSSAKSRACLLQVKPTSCATAWARSWNMPHSMRAKEMKCSRCCTSNSGPPQTSGKVPAHAAA